MTTPTTITVADRQGLVALMPYLLGFHPTNSLVLVGLDGSRVTLCARLDLDCPLIHARETVQALAQHRVTLLAVAYGDRESAEPALDNIEELAASTDCELADAMRITDGHIYPRCADGCCHPEPVNPVAAPAVHAVAAGISPARSRNDYAAQLAPVPDVEQARMYQAVEYAASHLTQLLAGATEHTAQLLVARLSERAITEAVATLACGGRLTDDQAARMWLLLTIPAVRDNAIRRLTGQREHIQFWIDLTRRCADEGRAWAATMLACAAIRHSNTMLAGLALDEAIATGHAGELTNLLQRCIRSGANPRDLADLIATL